MTGIMSKSKGFMVTLAYGFAVFIALGAVFGALMRGSLLPLIILVIIAVGYVGYHFVQGYAAGMEQ
jgi:fatty acid desaturase